jgi:hypothetical protein
LKILESLSTAQPEPISISHPDDFDAFFGWWSLRVGFVVKIKLFIAHVEEV